MSAEENKAISNRVAEAIGKGDLGAFDDLMAADLAEEFKRDIAEMRRAFPDYAGTNVNQIAEGDRVCEPLRVFGHPPRRVHGRGPYR